MQRAERWRPWRVAAYLVLAAGCGVAWLLALSLSPMEWEGDVFRQGELLSTDWLTTAAGAGIAILLLARNGVARRRGWSAARLALVLPIGAGFLFGMAAPITLDWLRWFGPEKLEGIVICAWMGLAGGAIALVHAWLLLPIGLVAILLLRRLAPPPRPLLTDHRGELSRRHSAAREERWSRLPEVGS